MTIDDCFSPALHRISHAIRSRAVHPNDPLPPIPEVLQKLSRQPEELQAAGKDVLAELVSAADVKKGTYNLSGVQLPPSHGSILLTFDGV